jgi:flagellar biosynthesis/type III secretory pathway protein FliH
VETDASQVDATVEHRLAAVVARVLGEERDGERAA